MVNVNGYAVKTCNITTDGYPYSAKRISVNGNTVWQSQVDLILNGSVMPAAGSLSLLKQQYESGLTYPSGFVLYQNYNSQAISRVDTANKIDWSKFNTLKIELDESDCRYCDYVSFVVAKNVNIPTWLQVYSHITQPQYEQKVFGYSHPVWSAGTILTLDVSDCVEEGVLFFGMRGNIGDVRIRNMWLE